MYMWRAAHREGEVLGTLIQKRRNQVVALKLLSKLLKNQGVVPERIVTDGLAFYRAALKVLQCQSRHKPGRLRDNNRVENSPLPVRRRERKMQRFKSWGQAQHFVATHPLSTTPSISGHYKAGRAPEQRIRRERACHKD